MNTTYIKKPDILRWYIYKILLIMRLTTVILMISMLQVSASTVAQEFNYVKKGASLIQIFKEIKKQTGYNVIWNEKKIDVTTTIDANFKKATIHDVLNKCLSNLPLSYSINDKMVMIKEEEPSFRKKLADFFNFIDVRGRVVDENNQPLVGATVKVKGTGQSTRSNEKGEFRLSGVGEKAILVISYLGYKTLEIAASENVRIVKLLPSTDELEEVEINTGYYKVSKREQTGSISRVDAKTIEKQPVANVLGALIGRMPGVNIEQLSGSNGGGFKVEIRGRNSLRTSVVNNGNQPLYLVDGIPYPSAPITNSALSVGGVSRDSSPLNYLSPSDIQSVEILKDADATAIYGSRGANGVVLITTKKGRATGKTEVEVNINTGASVVGKKLDLLNTQQYLEVRNEAFKNDGVTPGTTDYDLNGTWDKDRYTDWQKELIGGTASYTNIQAGIRGGSEFTRFVFRGNYNRQTTVYPADFAYQKGSSLLNLNHQSKDRKFNADVSFMHTIDYNNAPIIDLSGNVFSLAPNAPALYNTDGSLNWAYDSNGASTWSNPVAAMHNDYVGKTNITLANASLSYQVVNGLTFNTNLGYTNIRLKESVLSRISAQNPATSPTGVNRISSNVIETWIVEPQLNFKKNLGTGKLDMILGATFQKNDQNLESIAGVGYTNDMLIESITAAPTKGGSSTGSQYNYNALFSRINYNFQGKYILNLTGRRDGSSRFGPDKQFSNFGALGGAWLFSEENFIKSRLPALSFGKIRASYGITGSDQIADYGFLETYSTTSQPYQDGSGLIPTRIANPDYSWETSKKLEANIDLGFSGDRIMMSAGWYRNRSSNQLVGYTLPDITGFTSIQYNLPATIQNTGWEFEISSVNIDKASFSWSSSATLTLPRNKLLDYPNIEGSSYANTYRVGESVYSAVVYRLLGVNPISGLYEFEDSNGSGTLDIGDRRTVTKPLTSYIYGGFNNTIIVKNIQVDFFFQFSKKRVIDPMSQFGIPGFAANRPIQVLDRWQKSGDQKDIQKLTRSSGAVSQLFNTYYNNTDRIADGSFLRLKNVSVSWNAPKPLLNKIGLSAAKVFVQGQNLFTLTDYIGDPELGIIQSLPTLRTISAGLQLTF